MDIIALSNKAGMHRYNAAAAVMKDVLLIHGGEAEAGCVLASMAAFNLTPVLDVFSAKPLTTCAAVSSFRAQRTASWLPEWHACFTEIGPVSMHSMAVLHASSGLKNSSDTSDVLLLFGGVVSGAIVRSIPSDCSPTPLLHWIL
jgi:hypothetical protein